MDDTIINNELNWPSPDNRFDVSGKYIKSHKEAVKDREVKARKKYVTRPLWLFFVNGVATILVFIYYLISIESLLSVCLSVGFTIYTYNLIEGDEDFDGKIMSWTLLSFAIVTPMSSSISMAFGRRDRALAHIASLRSLFFSIYQAHASWDWGKQRPTGREKSKVDWLKHSDDTLNGIIAIGDELSNFLTLPTSSRARHRVLSSGKKQAKELYGLGEELIETIMIRVNRISIKTEVLKFEGMPANEAARIRHWERDAVCQIEGLANIKRYRTPQALRSLCRLFSVFLPPFYAPFYASMAYKVNSLEMAIAFSVITSVALTALFESLTQMEDPFLSHMTLDDIDVGKELQTTLRKRLILQRKHLFFPNTTEALIIPPEKFLVPESPSARFLTEG